MEGEFAKARELGGTEKDDVEGGKGEGTEREERAAELELGWRREQRSSCRSYRVWDGTCSVWTWEVVWTVGSYIEPRREAPSTSLQLSFTSLSPPSTSSLPFLSRFSPSRQQLIS